ncbi:hypothetical protein PHYPSEUDO_008549 [Phytophthora pseudosyringae]|uniref:Uncharacterized protein n=1 Tax=Phytophthora pseudosyringae TaxID=221518 RepID=A0A8T1VEB3_9STRA|nr:hypothetical protein PHYPSEUDO_008549 [Phytophthora pseudosyringae]
MNGNEGSPNCVLAVVAFTLRNIAGYNLDGPPSIDERTPGFKFVNYIRSEPGYDHWQFRRVLEVAVERNKVEIVEWAFHHFWNSRASGNSGSRSHEGATRDTAGLSGP